MFALLLPLLPVIAGSATGFFINALGVISSPAGVAVTRILPTAVRLAWSVTRGRAEAKEHAEALLKMAPKKVVEAEAPAEETATTQKKK